MAVSFQFRSTDPAREKQRFFSALRDFGSEVGWPAGIANEIELILEEWWTNLVSYAFAPGSDPEVRVEINSNEHQATLCIEDNGVPFDPTKRSDPDLTLPLEQRPVGGLGIYMIKKLSNNLRSQRRDGRNVLVIDKNLSQPVLGQPKS